MVSLRGDEFQICNSPYIVGAGPIGGKPLNRFRCHFADDLRQTFAHKSQRSQTTFQAEMRQVSWSGWRWKQLRADRRRNQSYSIGVATTRRRQAFTQLDQTWSRTNARLRREVNCGSDRFTCVVRAHTGKVIHSFSRLCFIKNLTSFLLSC